MYFIIKSDKLNIRNSPLDHLARFSARVVLCAKGACEQAQLIAIAKGIMLGVDTALKKADQKAIFGPLIGSALKTILPNKELQVKVSDLIKEPISQIDKNNQEIKDFIIDKVSK
jgi:hypothetical protein